MNPLNHFIKTDRTSKNMPMAGNKEPFDRDEVFQDKKNRDDRFKELKGMGAKVHKRSHGTQLMDPRYVTDSGNFRGKDEGLGNDYRHHFKNIYAIEKDYGADRVIGYTGKCKYCKSIDLVKQGGKIHCPECGRGQ